MRKISVFLGALMIVSLSLVAQEKISFTDLVTIDFNHLVNSKARIQKKDPEYTKAFDQLKVDAEKNLLVVKGSVPGAKNSTVIIEK